MFYKGLTNQIDRRLNEHFSGKSPTTKWQIPLELVHVEICESRSHARKLEKYFKSGYGREIIEEVYAEVAKPTCRQAGGRRITHTNPINKNAEVAKW